MIDVAAVVPTCRGFSIPKQTVPVTWYIVHDEVERDASSVSSPYHNIIAPDPEMFGCKCDSIRSAGFLRAVQNGAKYVLTVDDDCFIPPDWAEQHVEALEMELLPWSMTVAHRTRGLPYNAELLPVAISHGVWDGVLDLDARTQTVTKPLWHRNNGLWGKIHPPFPQSAMNFGFRAEVATVMYQPAQGADCVFDRFADIWGGLFAQRVLSLHGYAFANGGAVVYHQRASNVGANLVKEKPGMECHETFWPHVWAFSDKKATLTGTYMSLANHIEDFRSGVQEWDSYFSRTARNMRTWATLIAEFQSSSRSTSAVRI